MHVIIVLLAVSALAGLVLGFSVSRVAILVSGLVLAIVTATVLQKEGVGSVAGIAIIVVCLAVNQIAYLVGARLVHRAERADKRSLPHDQPNDNPGDSSHNDIAR
jgi:hypothetical protein